MPRVSFLLIKYMRTKTIVQRIKWNTTKQDEDKYVICIVFNKSSYICDG